MHDASSSQELGTEYVTWHAPGAPAISLRRRVMAGIHREVSEVFAAVPRRGAETGGILLGRRDGDAILIDDFEPVPCEHRFGPSYRLSDKDREALRETLEWFRGSSQSRVSVLGFYRSHTQPDFNLTEEDEELMQAHFDDPANVVLLIKPSRLGPTLADFFLRRQGRAEEAAVPMPFPFIENAPPQPSNEEPLPAEPVEAVDDAAPAEPPEVSTEPVHPELPPEPAPLRWPAPRSRFAAEPERPAKRGYLWYVAAAALGLIGGALGYVSLHSDESESRPPQVSRRTPAPAPVAPSTPVPTSTQDKPEQSTAERTGEDSAGVADTDTSIRQLLDRWSSALKRGDVQAAANCYAPVVDDYFSRHGATRDDVRQSIRQTLARHGGLDIYRVSGLRIIPTDERHAVITFRKHWQTAGYNKFAGEEQERMTVALNHGVWQIASEQQDRIYWSHRPR